jgi:hypothetical protein
MNVLTMLEDPSEAAGRVLPWVVTTHIKDGAVLLAEDASLRSRPRRNRRRRPESIVGKLGRLTAGSTFPRRPRRRRPRPRLRARFPGRVPRPRRGGASGAHQAIDEKPEAPRRGRALGPRSRPLARTMRAPRQTGPSRSPASRRRGPSLGLRHRRGSPPAYFQKTVFRAIMGAMLRTENSRG